MIVRALVNMATDPYRNWSAPFIEFDMSRTGFGSCFVPALARVRESGSSGGSSLSRTTTSDGSGTGGPEWVWPPTTGMTLSMWFRVVVHGMDGNPVRLACFFTPTPTTPTPPVATPSDGPPSLDPGVYFELLLDPNELCLVLQSEGGGRVRFGKQAVRPGRWVHLALVRACVFSM